MNFEHLTYFVEVTKCQSFNRAAKNLNIHPSTVSAAIDMLEQQFGSSLFYRVSSGVFPTDAGRLFYDDAVNILRIQQHWKYPNTLKIPEFTDVKIGVVSCIYNSVLPEITYQIAEQNKNIRLIPCEKQLKELDDGLFSGEYRIAIRTAQPEDKSRVELIAKNMNMNVVLLGHFQCAAFFPSESPLAAENTLTLQDLSGYQACSTENSFFEHYLSQVYPTDVRLFHDQTTLLNYLTIEKNTVTILADILKHSSYVKGGLLSYKNFSHASLPIDFYLFSPTQDMTEEEKAVVDCIHKFFHALS